MNNIANWTGTHPSLDHIELAQHQLHVHEQYNVSYDQEGNISQYCFSTDFAEAERNNYDV